MKHLLAFLAGVAAAYGVAALSGKRIKQAVEEMASVDLNTCSHASLTALGLTETEAEKIIESRPYRNKLDLLSQYIIPRQDYVLIKRFIGVNLARQNEGARKAG